MVIKSKHPTYASDGAKLEKLRQMKRLCMQQLAAARADKKTG